MTNHKPGDMLAIDDWLSEAECRSPRLIGHLGQIKSSV